MRKGDDHNLASAINEKYKFFSDKNADVILDVSEEQQRINLVELQTQEEVHDPYANINLSRKHQLKTIKNNHMIMIKKIILLIYTVIFIKYIIM